MSRFLLAAASDGLPSSGGMRRLIQFTNDRDIEIATNHQAERGTSNANRISDVPMHP
jgi:hypothetical protein